MSLIDTFVSKASPIMGTKYISGELVHISQTIRVHWIHTNQLSRYHAYFTTIYSTSTTSLKIYGSILGNKQGLKCCFSSVDMAPKSS